MILELFRKSNKSFVDTILELIYPENISCIICDKSIKKSNTYSMCKDCFNEMHFILDGCSRCGKPTINYSLEEEYINKCSYCHNKRFYFDRSISCIEYTDISKKIIFGLKYNNKTYMSKYIALIMKEKLDIESMDFDYILFVPLHKKRYRDRGFNQSEKIAKYLGDILDIEVVDCIRRKTNTKRLYKLNKEERKRELKDVFELNQKSSRLENKNILLIDDIFTTGSTVNEISKILKLSQVNKIFVMALLTRVNG
ncbi:MAG: ComF family protein [Romboutsia sp.]